MAKHSDLGGESRPSFAPSDPGRATTPAQSVHESAAPEHRPLDVCHVSATRIADAPAQGQYRRTTDDHRRRRHVAVS
jgi:hypothetical protein